MSGLPNDRHEMLPFVPLRGRVLDVGCDGGAFGSALTERGSEVWGIEPNAGAAARAASRLAKVVVGHYPDDLPSGETFDCIVFNDVLEHMPDPARALRAAPSHLNSDGRLVASIPNVRNAGVVAPLVLRGRWDYADWGVLDRTHLRFFTKATMRELFEANGYRVEHQEPINTAGFQGKRRVLWLLGRFAEEFQASQYALVARPR